MGSKLNLICCFLSSLFIFTGVGCKRNNNQQRVVRVNKAYLYKHEIVCNIPQELAPADSVLFAQNYTSQWINKQLMVQEAERTLSKAEKDISKELENYKNELLIYRYENALLKKRLNRDIDDSLVDSFYKAYKQAFILTHDIVQFRYVRVPKEVKITGDEIVLLKNRRLLNEKYISKHYLYNLNDSTWFALNELKRLLPKGSLLRLGQVNSKKSRAIEFTDSAYKYFVYIKAFKEKGDVAPRNYVKMDIASMILNQRQRLFLKHVKDSVYNAAVKKALIERFTY